MRVDLHASLLHLLISPPVENKIHQAPWRVRKKSGKSSHPAKPPHPPPRGGVQQATSKLRAPVKGKKIADTLVVAAAGGGLPRTWSKSRTEAASPSPELVQKLRVAEEEFWDHLAEKKNVEEFIRGGNL